MADRLLTSEEVAEALGVTPRALSMMRYKGTGPAHVKVSHKVVRYRESDVAAWVDSRVRLHSSRVV